MFKIIIIFGQNIRQIFSGKLLLRLVGKVNINRTHPAIKMNKLTKNISSVFTISGQCIKNKQGTFSKNSKTIH